jgi:hypothetical protein
MATPFFSSSKQDWLAVDGVYIDETPLPGKINPINAGLVGVVGEFERGPATPVNIGSAKDLATYFGGRGAHNEYTGMLGLVGRSFCGLRVCRVIPTGMTTATKAFNASASPMVTISANSAGVWGNRIFITVGTGSNGAGTWKLTVEMTDYNGLTIDTEVYDNLTNAALSPPVLIPASKYVTVSQTASTAVPDTAARAALSTTATDGTVSATDYRTAIQQFETESQIAVQILCASNPSDAVRSLSTKALNGYLAAHAQAFPFRTVIMAGLSSDSKSAAITYKKTITPGPFDNEVYTFNHPVIVLDGTSFTVGPETFAASVLSKLDAHQSLADPASVQLLASVAGLTLTSLTRQDYIDLKAAGIASIDQYDDDLGGYKFRSSVNFLYPTAQAAGTDQGYIERRHYASYCELSIARRLKFYQSTVLPLVGGKLSPDHLTIDGEIRAFLQGEVDARRCDSYLVDCVSGNTLADLSNGLFVIIVRVKMNPRADSIVLRAQVGNSVSTVVTQ